MIHERSTSLGLIPAAVTLSVEPNRPPFILDGEFKYWNFEWHIEMLSYPEFQPCIVFDEELKEVLIEAAKRMLGEYWPKVKQKMARAALSWLGSDADQRLYRTST